MPFSQQLCLSASRSQRHVPEDRSFTNSQSTETYCEYAEMRAKRAPQMLAAVNMDMVSLSADVDERLKQEQKCARRVAKEDNYGVHFPAK